jgi:hypothetical protein
MDIRRRGLLAGAPAMAGAGALLAAGMAQA